MRKGSASIGIWLKFNAIPLGSPICFALLALRKDDFSWAKLPSILHFCYCEVFKSTIGELLWIK